jgi:ribulose-5-phosphate 4-epimerase/fuculose-1-phosphate aldolase
VTEPFRSAGRALFSLGLVSGTEGNLSTFDGTTIVITRAGATLSDLDEGNVVAGPLEQDLDGASTDLAVHRRLYRERGTGAIVHAHPPGTVAEQEVISGEHGLYVFASSLERAVELAVDQARQGQPSSQDARR